MAIIMPFRIANIVLCANLTMIITAVQGVTFPVHKLSLDALKCLKNAYLTRLVHWNWVGIDQ